MEEPNIHRAEEKGRAHVETARKRFGGLLTQTLPPGLVDDTENVELNELDMVAHRYREAFESVRPLFENQVLIESAAKEVCSDARFGAEGNATFTRYAPNAAIGVAALRALGLWDKFSAEMREKIDRYLKDQMFISKAVEKVRSDAKAGAEGFGRKARYAIGGVAALHAIGVWSKVKERLQLKINAYIGKKAFIIAVALDVLSDAKTGAEGNALPAWSATRGAASLHTTGVWSKISEKLRKEMSTYLKNPTMLNIVTERVRFHAENGVAGNNESACDVIVDAAALKTLAEYYELEAKKLREKQGAAAARNQQTDKTLLNILPEKKF